MIVASADVMLSRSWKYVAFADASPHDDAAYAMRWWPNPMRIVPTTSAPSFGGVNGSAPVGLSSNIGIRPVTRSPETYGDGASSPHASRRARSDFNASSSLGVIESTYLSLM